MSDITGFDEKQKKNENEVSEEQRFITEKIVSKRKKKWLRRLITVLFVILCAALFGIVARYFFLVSGDALVEIFGIEIPVNREPVYVYKEKTPTPSPRPSSTPIVKLTETPRVVRTPSPTPNVGISPTPAASGAPVVSATPQPTIAVTPSAVPDITGTPGLEVTSAPGKDNDPNGNGDKPNDGKPEYSYAKFMEEVMDSTKAVAGVIVSVDGITTGTSFLGDIYEIRVNTTGLILRQDGVDVLILTDYESVEEAADVEVKFEGNDKAYAAKIYNYDKELGLAIIGVPISSLETTLFESMQYAVFCEKEDIEKGVPVFELGRANGYPDSLSFGIVSYTDGVYAVQDAEINYFTTDWQVYSGASGFVFNLDGYVLGTLTHAIKDSAEHSEAPCFIMLCTLEDELNILLNGGKLVDFGIYAGTLPNAIKETGIVESGIYLNRVVAASPAYLAGLRVGDVITSVNGNPINDMAGFMDILSDALPTQALNITYVRSYAEGSVEMSAYVMLTGR